MRHTGRMDNGHSSIPLNGSPAAGKTRAGEFHVPDPVLLRMDAASRGVHIICNADEEHGI